MNKCCKCGEEVVDGIIAIVDGKLKEPICIDCWGREIAIKMREVERDAVMFWLLN